MNNSPYAMPVDELLNELMAKLSPADIKESLYLADIAAKIYMCRVRMGMTQKEFADHLEVSQGMVSRWEKGDYNFTVGTLTQICYKLGLDLDIHLGDASSSAYHPFTPHIIHGHKPEKQEVYSDLLEVG